MAAFEEHRGAAQLQQRVWGMPYRHRDRTVDVCVLLDKGVRRIRSLPDNKEIQTYIDKNVNAKMFKSRYADVFKGDANWRGVKTSKGETYAWDNKSTYVQNPPYFEGMTMTPALREAFRCAYPPQNLSTDRRHALQQLLGWDPP